MELLFSVHPDVLHDVCKTTSIHASKTSFRIFPISQYRLMPYASFQVQFLRRQDIL